MRDWLKTTLVSSVALLAGVQIFRPARTNPPEEPGRSIHAVVPVEPAVGNLLSRSCNDCHSNSTSWPWYSHVAPVSWLVAADVNQGRRAMNLSDWADYSTAQRRELLQDICEETLKGEMPQSMYRLMHREARLGDADRQVLCSWAHRAGGGSAQEAQGQMQF